MPIQLLRPGGSWALYGHDSDLAAARPRRRCASLQLLLMSSFQLTYVTSELTINEALESRRKIRPRNWNHPLKARVVGTHSTPGERLADVIEHPPYSFKRCREGLKRIHAIAELDTSHARSLDAKWALPVAVTFHP